jgi:hypothetical protein
MDQAEADAWLAQHHHGEGLDLTLGADRPGLEILALTERRPVDEGQRFGIYDVLLVPAGGEARRITLRWQEADPVTVTLAAPAHQLTFPDLLRLAYEQNRSALDGVARPVVAGERFEREASMSPLLLPAIRGDAGTTSAALWLVDFWLF